MSPRSQNTLLRLTLVFALGLSACTSLFEPPATPSPAPPTYTPVPPTATPPPLAAIVNEEWITENEFLAEVARYQAARQLLGEEVAAEEAAKTVLDDLVAQVLLAQAARNDGFKVTQADLDTRIDTLSSQIGGAEALSTWQAEHGYTDEMFRSTLKRAIEAAWMRDKIIAAVPDTAEQVHARQILLYNEDTAQKVADQLAAGTDFAELAALYDPTTSGELGWFPRGYLLEPKLEEAAFALQAGRYSQVVSSEVGFHIIFVIERDPQHPLSPDAYLVMQEKGLQAWIEQERAEASIALAP